MVQQAEMNNRELECQGAVELQNDNSSLTMHTSEGQGGNDEPGSHSYDLREYWFVVGPIYIDELLPMPVPSKVGCIHLRGCRSAAVR